MSNIVLVFAGNKKEYTDYVSELKSRLGFTNTLWINVYRAEQAYKYKDFTIITVGTWSRHDWMHDVIEDLEHRIALRREVK